MHSTLARQNEDTIHSFAVFGFSRSKHGLQASEFFCGSVIISFMGVDRQGLEHKFSEAYHDRFRQLLEPEAVRRLPAHGGFLFVVAFLTWQYAIL